MNVRGLGGHKNKEIPAVDSRKMPLSVYAAFFPAAFFGLYTSFRYHFASWGIDPDSMASGIIWTGIREYGWGCIGSWYFTPDNWLISVILPTVPLYDAIGAHPMVISGLGWIAFVGSALLACRIATILAGRVAGLAVATVVLLANQYALGDVGFMSHPASHAISLGWGLLAFLLFYHWQDRRNIAALIVAAAVLCGDCISDPWATFGVAVPIAIGALVIIGFTKARAHALITLAMTLLCVLVAQTKVFGYLTFIPSIKLTFGSLAEIDSNFAWLAQGIAVIFNPVPGMHGPFVVPTAIVCISLAAMLLWAAGVLLSKYIRQPSELGLVAAMLASIVLPCGAFILSDLPQGLIDARFVPSLTILAPVVAISALPIRLPRAPLLARYGIPTFFILCGFVSIYGGRSIWSAPWTGMKSDGTIGLTEFLIQNHLSYGYGEYWGALANAVTLVSKDAVTMRPVSFDPNTGYIFRRYGQASTLWYSAADRRRARGRFFVAFKNDSENCNLISVCVEGTQRQFGKAAETLNYQGLTILVWDHPIAVN